MRYGNKKAALTAFILFGALSGLSSARAAVVDYSTTADFTCSTCTITGNNSGNVTVVFGSGANTATLLFTGVTASVNSDAMFTTAGYGTVTATNTGSGAQINGTLTIDLTQTTPNVNPKTGAFPTAALSGLVYNGSSSSYANFHIEDPLVTLGGPVVYELDTSKQVGSNPPAFGYTIISPLTGNPKGVTSFQGNIQATPEPAFLTLTGAGFIALAMVARRRKANVENV